MVNKELYSLVKVMKGKRYINYILGAASAFELWPVTNHSARPTDDKPPLSDYDAIKSDWAAVGGDIRRATELFQQQFSSAALAEHTDDEPG